MIHDVSTALAAHTSWLHRWFVGRGIDASTADDLVQLTLIEAWRNLAKLQDESGMRPWLHAIARHVLQRWFRSVARQSQLLQVTPDEYDRLIAEIPDDGIDEPSVAIEQVELAALVSRTMDQLPADTSDILKARYRDDLSVTEIAGQVGVNPAHMAVRLQRAREQMRAALAENCGAALAAYGFDLASVTWRSTRLWCPLCGANRLSMALDTRAGTFALKCPQCTADPAAYLYNWWPSDDLAPSNALGSVRTPRQALELTQRAKASWTLELGELPRCPRCDAGLTRRAHLPHRVADELGNLQLDVHCPACGRLDASATFAGMAIFHREGMAFWHEHDRINTVAPSSTIYTQTEAVRVDLASTSSTHTLTFFFSATGDRLLDIVTDA